MDAFIDAWLKEMHKPYKEKTFVIHTGSHGMDELSLTIQRENDRDHTEFLYDKRIITKEEKESILNMINSPDRENYTIARFILESKTNALYNTIDNHGTNVSSKKS